MNTWNHRNCGTIGPNYKKKKKQIQILKKKFWKMYFSMTSNIL